MLTQTQRELLTYLQEFVTHQRMERFEEILSRRTRMLTVVLEDVYQPHNQSAVLRTAEAVALQDVHIVESSNQFNIDQNVTMGSHRWLTIHRHRGEQATHDCLLRLRADGYRILAASPQSPATPLPEVVIDQKIAIFIGHETNGLSPTALNHADERVIIPMRGFVESFNLSVAAAICLYQLRTQLEASGLDWSLTDDEADLLRFEWTRQSISNLRAIEDRYFASRPNCHRET